jgi:hypothetical protein
MQHPITSAAQHREHVTGEIDVPTFFFSFCGVWSLDCTTLSAAAKVPSPTALLWLLPSQGGIQRKPEKERE